MYLHLPLSVINPYLLEFRMKVQSIILTPHGNTGPKDSSAVVYQIDFKGLLLML